MVGHVPGTEDIFNRTDSLDEVLLDCWLWFESESCIRKTRTYIVHSREYGSRP